MSQYNTEETRLSKRNEQCGLCGVVAS